MKTENVKQITVSFTDDNRNFVKVSGAQTIDEAVTAADEFLNEYEMCVKNGGNLYGDQTAVDEITFNVG